MVAVLRLCEGGKYTPKYLDDDVMLVIVTQMVDEMFLVLFLQLLCKFEIVSKEK